LKKKRSKFHRHKSKFYRKKKQKTYERRKKNNLAILRYHYTLLRISYIRKLAIFGIFCQLWQKIVFARKYHQKVIDDGVSTQQNIAIFKK